MYGTILGSFCEDQGSQPVVLVGPLNRDHLKEDMPEKMSERMSEDMSDRMSYKC